MASLDLSKIPGVDPNIPNPSRIYDYTLGGVHHFEADRRAAEFMFSLVPSTRKWVSLLRSCLQGAARRIAADGFPVWIDFASGLPTADHVHPVLPGMRVLYSDINPLTITIGDLMVKDEPLVSYHAGDIRRARDFLERPEVVDFIGPSRRVAFGAGGISVFLTAEENQRFFRDLYEWAEPGAKLFTTFETKAKDKTTPRFQQFTDVFAKLGEPFYFYTLEESKELVGPWTPSREAFLRAADFVGKPSDFITEEDREGVDLEFYAVILEKKAV